MSARTGPLLRRVRLHTVVIFSLPPFLAAVWLLLASTADYRRMRQFDDWWSSGARVDHFAWWRVRAALRLPQAMALDERLSVEDRQRPLVDLRVARDEFDRMAGDPVGRAGESIKAWLAEGEALVQEVDLKLRGDTSVHWTGEKKTLSIKSARDAAYQGASVNVFSAKEVLAQHTANSLAAEFELLAPPTAVVPVFLNQRFYGMFRHFAPLDERFPPAAGRLPGNIFRGDTAERGDYFKGVPRELFVDPYIWDRVASEDRPGSGGMERLFELVARVNRAGGGEALAVEQGGGALAELFLLVDRGEIARLLALDLCVGDPWHSSGVHNHFWYEDPSDGRLHPIPWDLRMLELERPPPGASFNRFWRAALRDPRVFAEALAEIRARNEGGKLLAETARRVESLWELYRDGFEYDRLRCGPPGGAANPDVGSPQVVLETLRANLEVLDGWCRDARASVAVSRVAEHEALVDVLVDGRAPIELWALALDPASDPVLAADLDPGGERFQADRRIALEPDGGRSRLARPEALLPGVRAGASLAPEPLHYRYFLRFRGELPSASAFLLRNRLTGEAVDATPLSAGSAVPATTSVHPWDLRPPSAHRAPGELTGELHLTRTLEVARPPEQAGAPGTEALVIAPGTTVTLDPDVSIRCEARIEARGTAERPITFVSSDPRRPWGTLLLLGEGASKSVFEHVRFSGGGGAELDGIACSGMVCVHGARDVVFEHCEFAANLRCEDQLHAARAGLRASDCRFVDANATAFTLEHCEGAVERCHVERAGKHGIAVRGGSPRIEGCEISGCAGSGVSVGGDSRALVFASTITGCKTGVEARDRAEPLVLDVTLAENRTGVEARLASSRFDCGGWPRVVRTRFSDNAVDVDVDKRSALTALESPTAEGDGRSEALDDAQLAWIQSATGRYAPAGTLGAPESWRTEPPARIAAEERFAAGWIAPEAAWKRSGGATSLRVEGRALAVRMGAARGRISRAVEWELTDAARESWLVLEASSTGIKSARLCAAREGSADVCVQLNLPGGSDERFAFTSVMLPPGRYTSLALEFEPYDAAGRLCLGGWQVVTAPARGASR